MKDGQPRPISQLITLKDAMTDGSPVASYCAGTVPAFNNGEDLLSWRWTSNGEYSERLVYKIFIEAGKLKWGFMYIWDMLVPLKIKLFSNLLLRDRLPTREMLMRRGMNCDPHCSLCHEDAVENSLHLFFQCQNAIDVWSQVNNLVQSGDTVNAI